MITEWPYIYRYRTAREDFPYAVGVMPENGPADGGVALFAEREHVELFMVALQKQIGGTVDHV